MRCVFYVMGEDDPRFTLQLPYCPPRGMTVRYGGRTWAVNEFELRVDGEARLPMEEDRDLYDRLELTGPHAHLVVWLTTPTAYAYQAQKKE